MNVTAVNVARLTGFFSSGSEISIGRVPIQDATKFFCDRYGFTQYPKTLEEWQKPEGAVFGYGQLGGIIITGLVIYARGFSVATQTSTDDCVKVLDDLLSSAPAALGISLPRPITRKLFYSELTFVMGASLNALHPVLPRIAERVDPFVQSFVPGGKYEVSAIYLNVDDSNLKYGAGALRIERRTGIPFNENTYFSAAPMPTGEHIKALQDLEAALLTPPRKA